MSAEEEGIREMPGKPRRCPRKPKQDTDRRTENFKGPLLRENRINSEHGVSIET